MPKALITLGDLINYAEQTFKKEVLGSFIEERVSILKWTPSDVRFATRALLDQVHGQENFMFAVCRVFQCTPSDFLDFKKRRKLDGRNIELQIIERSLENIQHPISAKLFFNFFKYQRDFYNISMRQSALFCGISDGTIAQMNTAMVIRRHTTMKILSAYQSLIADIKDFNQEHSDAQKLMRRILNAKHLSGFFRSKRTDRMMSMFDIYQQSSLTMRIMSDLENKRQHSHFPFIVKQLCLVFDVDINEIKAFDSKLETKITPKILQRFVKAHIPKDQYHITAKKASLSPSGLKAFLESSNPDSYKMNTLRSICNVLDCTPRIISDFGKLHGPS